MRGQSYLFRNALLVMFALTFRTVASSQSQSPYFGAPFSIPGTIQAEDFDNGGEGVAYHDVDASNNGGRYRQTGVDLRTVADAGGGYHIGWIKAGEWVEYMIDVDSAGMYDINLRIASASNGGTLHVEFNGVNVTGTIAIPHTGSWDTYRTITKAGVSLTAGEQVMRLAFDANGSAGTPCDVNYISISPVASGSAPTITAHPASQTVAVGQTATFAVSASGSEPLQYQWQKNNLNIGGATSSSYTTPSVNTNDNGSTFRCIVSNSIGTVTSNSATLSVSSSSDPQSPFLGTPFSIPGTMQAEDFDNGGEGFAYHDVDASNNGGQYRQTGVDLRVVSDVGSGYHVGWIKAGEWLEYTVNVGAAGTYTIALRVASATTGGTLHVEFNGANVTGAMTIPSTGSWNTYQTLTKTGVSLNGGQQVMRIAFDTDGSSGTPGDLNYISVTAEGSPSAPTITSHPSNQSASAGQAATFTVSAAGTTPLFYQWQKNNLDVGGATNTSYTTPPVSTSDNGSTFRCIVSNSAGTVTSNSATLNVTSSSEQTPFLGAPFAIPGTIQAEDFDNGGEGVAYHDVDASNNGGQYRQTGVDLRPVSDAGGGYHIGWIKASEWVEYTVNVASAGTYALGLRVASASNGGALHVEFGGVNVTGGVTIPNTGSWNTYQSITRTVSLNAGQQVMRLAFDNDGSAGTPCDVNYIAITSGASGSAPTISQHPSNQTVGLNQTATFTVSASGSEPLAYQWQKNTLTISGAMNSSYTTPPVSVADSGSTFRCVVSNSVGTVTSNSAMLAVTTAGGPTPVPFQYVLIDNQNPPHPHQTAVGDISGDGFPDIAQASGDGFRTGLFWWKYPQWTKTLIDTGSYSTDMQMGDIDSDGDLDIVITRGIDYGISVWWYQNPLPTGDPTVAPWTRRFVGNAATHDLELGDINQDGKLDIVVRNTTLTIFFQEPDTTWRSTIISQRPWEGTALGDIDCDGDLDIAINSYWYENPLPAEDPRFTSWTERLIDANWPTSVGVHLRDLNDDGRMDVVLAPSAANSGRLAWYETPNPLTGPWTQHVIDTFVKCVHTFKTADMDLDGDIDIVTGEGHYCGAPHYITVYLNQDSASSWYTQRVATTGIHNLRIADIGSDGDIDIVGSNAHNQNGNTHGSPLEMWENLLRSPNQPARPADAVVQHFPQEFSLEQNYPNPFNPITTIRFTLPTNVGTEPAGTALAGMHALSLRVYDVLGREVATLVNEEKPARPAGGPPGTYNVTFDASHLPSGMYIYRLRAGPFTDARKLVVVK
ncbi:MAG: carbohydrate-binding protein [Ignavibacteriae bacterium]|nr:carbohydrate-binding protein [Ignavibacteriota bacterium]